jgi:hypothetical protein
METILLNLSSFKYNLKKDLEYYILKFNDRCRYELENYKDLIECIDEVNIEHFIIEGIAAIYINLYDVYFVLSIGEVNMMCLNKN